MLPIYLHAYDFVLGTFDTQPNFSNILFLFYDILRALELTMGSNFTKQSMLFLN